MIVFMWGLSTYYKQANFNMTLWQLISNKKFRKLFLIWYPQLYYVYLSKKSHTNL